MRPQRWVIVGAVVVLVLGIIGYGFLSRPVPVDTARTLRGPLAVTVEEEGKTRVRERFVVSAPVAGVVRRIELEAGDAVKKGQIVAEIEPLRSAELDPRSRAEAEAALVSAEAALVAAEEELLAATSAAEYAAANRERMKKLSETGYISRDSLDQAETEARQADANRLSAEAAVGVAKGNLLKARGTLSSAPGWTPPRELIVPVRAPAAGRVLTLRRESEGVVQAGDALIDLGDPAMLEVRVEVLSADAVRITQGMKVTFERWGGSPALSGTVRTVETGGFTKVSSLGVEEQRVLVIADIVSAPESWQRLGDGYRVEALFVLWEGKNVLQVPASALFRKGEGWAVFAVRDGRARERSLEVGHRNGLAAEVLSGLEEGDEVIIHPDDAIRDGVKVRPRRP